VLSVVIGVAVPALLPKTYTHYAAAALFAYFGVRLLREASTMAPSTGGNEELEEAEAELGLGDTSGKREGDGEGASSGGAVTVVVDASAGGDGEPAAAALQEGRAGRGARIGAVGTHGHIARMHPVQLSRYRAHWRPRAAHLRPLHVRIPARVWLPRVTAV
jgi:hypothetical protein